MKIYNIVKSRFIKGENLPDWYEKRLQICSTCHLNSKNIKQEDKGTIRKGWELIAGAHCTNPTCGCTITEKAKIETEFCPEKYWGKEYAVISDKLQIVSKNSQVNFKFDNTLQKYVLDYTEIKYQSDSFIELNILDKNIEELVVRSSCGCTTASPIINKDSTITISIKYDTNRIGSFSKNVTLKYKINKIEKETVINVKGKVLK